LFCSQSLDLDKQVVIPQRLSAVHGSRQRVVGHLELPADKRLRIVVQELPVEIAKLLFIHLRTLVP
jgi:hypothetical protein